MSIWSYSGVLRPTALRSELDHGEMPLLTSNHFPRTTYALTVSSSTAILLLDCSKLLRTTVNVLRMSCAE